MDYHQLIAGTCEETVAALSQTLSAHGYRLERSFDLRSARHATSMGRDQYLVLLAYEQGMSAPPVVITAHECEGITRLSVEDCPSTVEFKTLLAELAWTIDDGSSVTPIT